MYVSITMQVYHNKDVKAMELYLKTFIQKATAKVFCKCKNAHGIVAIEYELATQNMMQRVVMLLTAILVLTHRFI